MTHNGAGVKGFEPALLQVVRNFRATFFHPLLHPLQIMSD